MENISKKKPMNIGLISPVSIERSSLKKLLHGLGHNVFIIDAGEDMFNADKYKIDVFLVSDLLLLQKNKEIFANYPHLPGEISTNPVVAIVEPDNPDPENTTRIIGAGDFVARPLNRFVLDARIRLAHSRSKKQLADMAFSEKERLWVETIRKASELVTQAQQLENSFSAVAHHLQHIIPLNQFVISLNTESGVHYEVVGVEGNADTETNFTVQLCQDTACTQRQSCVRGEHVICDSVKDHDQRLAEGMKSCICLGLYDGERRLGALSLSSYQADAFNESQLPHLESLALQVAHTVTNIQRYQQASSEAKRMEVIVREVHHRIKNNLQGVIGLFGRYQEEQPELAPILNGAISQLYAVAEVHNLLSHHTHETVDWHGLIQSVCQVSKNLSPHKVDYSLDVKTANLYIAASEAVPMALVLNELIQNAINHGYPDGRIGMIRVSAEVVAEGKEIRLAVANDGVPPPEMINNITHVGFGIGLQLVRSLLPSEANFCLHRLQDWTLADVTYPVGLLMEKNLEKSA